MSAYDDRKLRGVTDVRCLSRTRPTWLVGGFRLRRAPITWFPVIPGYAELIPGSPENFPVTYRREFLRNRLIQRLYFCKNRWFLGRIQEIPG
jgi:hypothetical protein